MARRKARNTNPGHAFLFDETAAVSCAIAKLYRRHVHHIVHPAYPRPSMVETWRASIDPSVWDAMELAQQRMALPSNTWQYFQFTASAPIPGAEHANLVVTTKRLLPDGPRLPNTLYHGTAEFAVYGEFVRAVYECRQHWVLVWDTFTKLNTAITRKTAAFHWPCAAALMAFGGVRADDLTNEITRAGNIPGELSVQCRDTSAFVMQHMMLPPIDSTHGKTYEGDEEKGLAAYLSFSVRHNVLGDSLWPVAE